MTLSIAEFYREMKPAPSSSIDMVMKFERPLKPRTEEQTKRIPCSTSLPLFETGLTTALRRAYAAPRAANIDEFDTLLARIA